MFFVLKLIRDCLIKENSMCEKNTNFELVLHFTDFTQMISFDKIF